MRGTPNTYLLLSSPGLDRAIQYSEAPEGLSSAAGYWMPRLKRGMTVHMEKTEQNSGDR